MTTSFRLESPSAAIAAVPYLLGYQPESCMVAIHLVDAAIGMTMRMPLPWCDDDGPADVHDDESLAVWAELFVARSVHVDSDAVVVICFADIDRDSSQRSLHAVQDAYRARGLVVRDALLVTRGRKGERWRSMYCTDDCCCPPEGNIVVEAEADRAKAFFVLHGYAPLPTRVAVVAELDPAPTERRATVCRHAQAIEAALRARLGDGPDAVELEKWRDEAIARIEALLGLGSPTPARWSEEEIAESCLCLLDARVRDTIVWELARPERESIWTAVSALLADAVRCAPEGCTAPVATMLAQVRWSLGDGARAAMALERALDDDADYVMAKLMRHAITSGIPPASWLRTLRALPRAEFRYGVGHVPKAS